TKHRYLRIDRQIRLASLRFLPLGLLMGLGRTNKKRPDCFISNRAFTRIPTLQGKGASQGSAYRK
ncbi:MAG: hypothetical protein ACYSW3_22695, partial [Planctomycetota bacterium]